MKSICSDATAGMCLLLHFLPFYSPDGAKMSGTDTGTWS